MSDESTRPRLQVPIELAEIIKEIQQADPMAFPPNDPVTPNEKPYRVLEDQLLRRIFAIQNMYRREALHGKVDCSFSGDQQDIENYRLLEAKASFFRELFWFLVRQKYNWWDDTVGIREGWMLVSYDDSNPLKALFGGILPTS